MKFKRLILFGFTLLIVVGGWNFGHDGKVTPMLPVTATTQTCEIESAVGVIYQVENDPNLQEGQLLCGDEILQPATGTKVALVCFDQGKPWEVSSGDTFQVGEYCDRITAQAEPESDCETDSEQNCVRDRPRPSTIDCVEIISPFNSEIINSRPYIFWKNIESATGYSVKIEDITGSWGWRKQRNNSDDTSGVIAFPYPEDKDSLPPGTYTVTVEPISESIECTEEKLFRVSEQQS